MRPFATRGGLQNGGTASKWRTNQNRSSRASSLYHEVYARWQRDTEGFWGEAAQEIDWIDSDQKALWRWQREWLCQAATQEHALRSLRSCIVKRSQLQCKAWADGGYCRMKL